MKVSAIFWDRSLECTSWNDDLPPMIQARFKKNLMDARNYSVIQYSEFCFGVGACGEDLKLVNLEAKTCSCKEYQEFEFPCKHVAKALANGGFDFPPFISRVYYTETLKDLYSGRAF